MVACTSREVMAMRKLAKSGCSTRKIGDVFSLSSASVSYWLRAKWLPGDLQRRAPRLDRGRAKAIRARRRVVASLAKKITTINGRRRAAFGSSTAIRAELIKKGQGKVHRSTIVRDLHEEGFASRRRQRVPACTEADFARRLKFCHRVARDGLQAKNIAFSDEKYFNTNDYGHRNQWVRPGQTPEALERSRWPWRVMVWGAVGVGFKHLKIIEAKKKKSDSEDERLRLTSETYIRLISPCVNDLASTGKIFMQDGAACHTAKRTMQYLERKRIPVLQGWPAKSPDMNPIERVWAILQARVAARNPDSVEDLKKAIAQEWAALDQDTIDRVVRGFDSRVRAVRAAGGRW